MLARLDSTDFFRIEADALQAMVPTLHVAPKVIGQYAFMRSHPCIMHRVSESPQLVQSIQRIFESPETFPVRENESFGTDAICPPDFGFDRGPWKFSSVFLRSDRVGSPEVACQQPSLESADFTAAYVFQLGVKLMIFQASCSYRPKPAKKWPNFEGTA